LAICNKVVNRGNRDLEGFYANLKRYDNFMTDNSKWPVFNATV